MAYLEIGGLGPNGKYRVTRLEFPDDVMSEVVQAVAVTEGYHGDDPGQFVIDRIVKQFEHTVKLYKKAPLHRQIDATIDAQVSAITSAIVVKVDGEEKVRPDIDADPHVIIPE